MIMRPNISRLNYFFLESMMIETNRFSDFFYDLIKLFECSFYLHKIYVFPEDNKSELAVDFIQRQIVSIKTPLEGRHWSEKESWVFNLSL